MKFLIFLLKHYTRYVMWAILFGLLSGAVNAWLIATVSMNVARIGSGVGSSITTYALLVLLVFFLGVITELIIVRLSTRVTLSLRLNICHQILECSLRQFEKSGSARLMAVFTEDIPSLNGALLKIPVLFVNVSIIAGCLIYLGFLSPMILLIFMGFVIFSSVIYLVPEKVGMKLIKNSRDAWDQMLMEFSAMLHGFKELKLHFLRRESFYNDFLLSSGDRVRTTTLKHRFVYLVLRNLSQLLYFTFMGVLLFYLPTLWDLELQTIAGFTIVGLYVFGPIVTLIDAIPVFRQAGVSFNKIEQNGLKVVISEDNPFRKKDHFRDHLKKLPPFETLSVEGVTHVFFREKEDSLFTLGPIDLSFQAGELTFIIGGNGSGKTTLAKLLTGLYQPDSGRLVVNGVPIDEHNVEVYHQFFSTIFSDFFVFEQIMGMEKGRIDDHAREYLEKLHLSHKVNVTDGNLSNVNLSAGQRKRLALLTAYLEDRQIYVFDEWAADQDPEFKEIFYRHLLPELKSRGKTVFVISHDDRFFDVADRLVKMTEGQIVEDRVLGAKPKPVVSQAAAQGLRFVSSSEAQLAAIEPPTSRSRWLYGLGFSVAALLLLGLAVGFYARSRVMASLPILDGELTISGLSAPVTIQRDTQGVPAVTGSNRSDLVRATGFLHAQERFFQMDLLRRNAAGELAELFGPAALPSDRGNRVHRFKERARRLYAAMPLREQNVLKNYADGVNQGLQMMGDVPPEYLLLRAKPEPWVAEDAILVVFSMFLDLDDVDGEYEAALGNMFRHLPKPLVDFLAPIGTHWDAPIAGGPIAEPPIPGPQVIDLHATNPKNSDSDPIEPVVPPGSNAWAVSSSFTADGGALLANDMHLGLRVPNTWYRLCLKWPDNETGSQNRIVGATLPGTPGFVVASTGHIAWGFASNVMDSTDLIILEKDPLNPDNYLTPDGPQPIQKIVETIEIKGQSSEEIVLPWTIWGPIIGKDDQDRDLVLSWTAHHDNAVNFRIMDLERATTVAAAMDIANTCGLPAQSFVVADKGGDIGWTVLGRLPRRVGFDGRTPASWADGSQHWDGWYEPAEYPRVINPEAGRIWAANTRPVDGDMLAKLGDPGFQLGARARQIRDSLMELEKATAQDMLAIQLDDRALFLAGWRDLILELMTPETLTNQRGRAEFRRIVEQDWSGHASIDSAGYRLVRSYRLLAINEVFPPLTRPCSEADEQFSYNDVNLNEAPLWRLVTQRPANLLPPGFDSWEALLLHVVDNTIDYFQANGGVMSEMTWGRRNYVKLSHPLSQAVPQLGRWLDLPGDPLPGDVFMPRLQNGNFGPVQRMVVSPGREEQGVFHMPGGQSGHPFSPFYGNSHEAWVQGKPTPLLPGPPMYTLTLKPAK